MTPNTNKILLFVLFFSSIVLPQSDFNKDSVHKYISVLADDSLQGRGTGTEGERIAAEYLAGKFRQMGLEPAGDKRTYFQNIPMHGSFPLESSDLRIYSDNRVYKLMLNDDYLIYKPGEQNFQPTPVPLVFVGYGITAPEFDYNDYQSVDVEGRIVVFLEGEPASDDKNYFNGNIPTIYSYPEAKQRIALAHGAIGSIMIPDISDSNSWEKTRKRFEFEYMSLAYSVTSGISILMNPAAAEFLFTGIAYSLQDIYRLQKENNMISIVLSTEISFKGEFKEKDFISKNIIGEIEGTDHELKNTYMVISAHYDHLGIGPPVDGDSVYNGAFDNAAGVAAVLQLAGMFAESENRTRRSVLFILLTGEEKGLLGSTYYVDHSVVPLYKTVANLNIDGISLFDSVKSIIGVGAEYSTLSTFLSKTADDFNLSIVSIPPVFDQYESFFRSDQIAFAMAGVPSLLISEGLKYVHLSDAEGLERILNYSQNIYHTPFDDLSQPMNLDAAVQYLNIVYDFCKRILNSETKPEWNQNSPFVYERLRTIAEKR